MKVSSILGLNARATLYAYPHNTREGKRIARSKLMSGRILKAAGIPTPKMFAKFRKPNDIFKFDWNTLPSAFALKPSKGLGGEGIIVVKKKSKNIAPNGDSMWITTQKVKITPEDLKLHILDILEGAYSIGNIPDVAFIQEYVGRHKAFRKFAYRGTPDIRIIIFNKVPVMAMLRLPTKESGGRANLHQGAVGVGIDIATGITTRAVHYGTLVTVKPGTERKLNGIRIPMWEEILRIAVECQRVSGLGYLGVDIVLHPEKGPMVLELNSQPGLQIQLANMAGLRRRLDRVDEMEVRDAEHGVAIGRAMFGEKFSGRVKSKKEVVEIGASEEVVVRGSDGKRVKVTAKIDTGAWSSSIDKKFAESLGLLNSDKILWYRRKISALGESQRPVISVTFWLKDKKITTTMGVADRTKLTYKALIGRTDLQGFLVKPWIEKKEKGILGKR